MEHNLTAETPSLLLQPVGRMAEAMLRTEMDCMAPTKAGGFPREARLLRHADFQRVYKQGRRHFSPSMTVFYWARTEAVAADGLRIGLTVGRALGGAVERNRMKRRLREAVRMTRPVGGVAADVVINPKKTVLAAEFSGVVKEVARAFAAIEQRLQQVVDAKPQPAPGQAAAESSPHPA